MDLQAAWAVGRLCRELRESVYRSGFHDLVGAVGIGGVDFRLDLGGVVEEQIEHIVALVFVGKNRCPQQAFSESVRTKASKRFISSGEMEK